MNLLRIAARVASRRYAAADIEFSGTLSQRFDGENCYVEGKLTIDGEVHDFLGSTSGRSPAQMKLDGQPLEEENNPLYENLTLFFEDIWPPEDGNWDAEVKDNVTSSPPVPAED